MQFFRFFFSPLLKPKIKITRFSDPTQNDQINSFRLFASFNQSNFINYDCKVIKI